MPGFVYHQNAAVDCQHSGRIKVNSPGQVRVKVGGQLVNTSLFQNEVTGCSHPDGPCARIQWRHLSTRIKCYGQPVLLYASPLGLANGVTEGPAPVPPQGQGVQPRVLGL
ncbi:hypothetical protein [Allokutzneria albata]|uniref:Uncharacterized protein n=1 Tax=Allokutzneria albata TaxID=211114 RepID=A0A1G9QYL8_ALLAB|nr:hypothetical protein [Allokutzneria albata]SDM16074.1 hypothetical protein SAMN04489726_0090 [Allokutzneria albata]